LYPPSSTLDQWHWWHINDDCLGVKDENNREFNPAASVGLRIAIFAHIVDDFRLPHECQDKILLLISFSIEPLSAAPRPGNSSGYSSILFQKPSH
jgi:hypothetical protein